MRTVVDFFAGSGLVSAGLSNNFKTIWANDIDASKAEVYDKNISDCKILVQDISSVDSNEIPCADMFWASFPCQDLSLAGNYQGLSGSRSSLVNEFFRILEAKEELNRPSIVILENVYGLITSNHGHDFLYIHSRLTNLGYNAGAVVLDAAHWVPQSRVRVFIIAVKRDINISRYTFNTPNWTHPFALRRVASKLNDFIYWHLDKPGETKYSLEKIIDRNVQFDKDKSKNYSNLIKKDHLEMLNSKLNLNPNSVFTGYKRTRDGVQTLEIRFDNIAGCLRTATGGSSKQLAIYKNEDDLIIRYLTPREAARLMGAPDSFWLPSNKNNAYTAMGDAVAFPVTAFLSDFVAGILENIASVKYA